MFAMNHLTDGPLYSLIVVGIIGVVMACMGAYYMISEYLNATPLDEECTMEDMYHDMATIINNNIIHGGE